MGPFVTSFCLFCVARDGASLRFCGGPILKDNPTSIDGFLDGSYPVVEGLDELRYLVASS